MKKIVIISIISLVLNTSLQELLIVANFYINRSVLTNEFCINKSDLNLNCHASCYLSKELDLHNKQNNKKRTEILKFKLSQFIIPKNITAFISFNKTTEIEHHFMYKFPHIEGFNAQYFRPPKVRFSYFSLSVYS